LPYIKLLLCFLFVVTVSSLPLAGGGPAATHFSCFAKKSKQKKATQAPLPFGFPIVQDKNGESQKLATLRHLPLFIPFLSRTIGSVTCVEKPIQKQRPTAAIGKIAPIDTDCFEVAVAFEFVFDLPPFETM
jgi:hypothetical protein